MIKLPDGFTLCEGTDTAHRGVGVGWPLAAELIRRCGAEARATLAEEKRQ